MGLQFLRNECAINVLLNFSEFPLSREVSIESISDFFLGFS